MKIALNGKIGSGKSWVADRLSCDRGFFKTSFAFRIKELAVELFDMQGKDRDMLVEFSEKMKTIDSQVWIKRTLKECKGKTNIIIDDMRFREEYEILKKNGWILIKIKIPEEERIENIYSKYDREDAKKHLKYINSFTENDPFMTDDTKFDLILKNKETMEEELYNFISKSM
jgi:cytidylate kinase